MNSVFIVEVGCCIDLCMDTCYYTKLLKYQPLMELISLFSCRLMSADDSVGFGLGHVCKNVVRGLQKRGLQKMGAIRLAKLCSVSAIIICYP